MKTLKDLRDANRMPTQHDLLRACITKGSHSPEAQAIRRKLKAAGDDTARQPAK